MFGFDLQYVIYGVVDGKTCNNEQPDTPIEQEHRQRHDRCGENALSYKHDHTGEHTGGLSIVLVVTEVIVPRLFSLK